MSNVAAKWTISDYHQMIRSGILDDRHVELIAGDIFEMAPEGPEHTYAGGSLSDRFRDCLHGSALVREARPITLSDSEPEPDIALVAGNWTAYRDRHPGPTDIFLLVEISRSTLSFDLTQKRDLYAAAGVPEYWVVDLQNRRSIVFRNPSAKVYQSHQILTTGTIAPLAFPNCAIAVADLFR